MKYISLILLAIIGLQECRPRNSNSVNIGKGGGNINQEINTGGSIAHTVILGCMIVITIIVIWTFLKPEKNEDQ